MKKICNLQITEAKTDFFLNHYVIANHLVLTCPKIIYDLNFHFPCLFVNNKKMGSASHAAAAQL